MKNNIPIRSATDEDYERLNFYSVGTLHRASTLQAMARSSGKQEPQKEFLDLTNLPFDPAQAAGEYSEKLSQEQAASSESTTETPTSQP
jgi:hypothetical protein